MQYWFELLLPESDWFRWQILILAAINVVLCVVLEDGIVEHLVFRRFRNRR